MKKWIVLFSLIFCSSFVIQAQSIGFGYVNGFDLYQRIKNPDIANDNNSVGSAMINYTIGPKIWMGNKKYSLSFEGQANIGLLAYDTKNYRGIGAVSFPLMAKFNTKSLSGFAAFPFPGISIGGGIQYSLTDLLFVKDEYKEERGDWFSTYVIELGVGLGMNGKDGSLYVRYGFGENNSKTLHIGILQGLNYTVNSKYKKKKQDGEDGPAKKGKKKRILLPF